MRTLLWLPHTCAWVAMTAPLETYFNFAIQFKKEATMSLTNCAIEVTDPNYFRKMVESFEHYRFNYQVINDRWIALTGLTSVQVGSIIVLELQDPDAVAIRSLFFYDSVEAMQEFLADV